ncbi:MAG: hypothetical protein MJ252_13850 [archaeon]|nr:hypothetical protein [archaeon]
MKGPKSTKRTSFTTKSNKRKSVNSNTVTIKKTKSKFPEMNNLFSDDIPEDIKQSRYKLHQFYQSKFNDKRITGELEVNKPNKLSLFTKDCLIMQKLSDPKINYDELKDNKEDYVFERDLFDNKYKERLQKFNLKRKNNPVEYSQPMGNQKKETMIRRQNKNISNSNLSPKRENFNENAFYMDSNINEKNYSIENIRFNSPNATYNISSNTNNLKNSFNNAGLSTQIQDRHSAISPIRPGYELNYTTSQNTTNTYPSFYRNEDLA